MATIRCPYGQQDLSHEECNEDLNWTEYDTVKVKNGKCEHSKDCDISCPFNKK